MSRCVTALAPLAFVILACSPASAQDAEDSVTVDGVIAKWKKATSQWTTLDAGITLRNYDGLSREREVTIQDGRLYFDKPDKGRLHIWPLRTESASANDAAHYRPRAAERWYVVWTEGRIRTVAPDRKSCEECSWEERQRVRERIEDLERNGSFWEWFSGCFSTMPLAVFPTPQSLLPFLLDEEEMEIRDRFEISLETTADGIELRALPRTAADKARWRMVRILLDPETYLPFAWHFLDPNGKDFTTICLRNIKIDRQPTDRDELLNPDLSGYDCRTLLATPARDPSPTGFLNNGVTAHRGNSSEHPENTVPAFESAIAAGADWLELDIFRTSDGKLVVIHDGMTERVGDRNLDVAKSTYEELLTVDVATEFRRRHGKTLDECPKRTIPLLEDVLRLVVAQKKTRVSIQPKMDCVADAMALVKRMGAQKWVGFNDGNLQYMAQVKRLDPTIRVFWDRGPSDIEEDIRIAQTHGFESLVLHHSIVTPEKIEKIHAAGIEAGAWTVNDEAAMRRLLEMGVDRLYTDFPKRLLRLKQTTFSPAQP